MWLFTAFALLACLIGPFVLCVRGDTVSRLVALEGAGAMIVVLLLVLCEIFHRAIFVDAPLSLALLTFGSGLVFARFLERWL
jgi:multicomponent Na+:H+ antiporter subunit F